MKTSAIYCIALVGMLLSCTNQKKETINTSSEKETVITTTEKPLLAEAVSTTISPVNKPYYVIANSGLSLRKGTNLRSEKLLTLPYGSQISYLYTPENTEMIIEGIQGAMIAVEYQGAKGFVFSGYTTQIAPPREDESFSAYAKRISTDTHKVVVTEQAHPKGSKYGMTKSIELPAKDWKTTLNIAQRLLDLPKTSVIDLSNSSKHIYVNPDKRTKTVKDEYEVKRGVNGSITTLTYTYQIRDYSRSVTIIKKGNNFILKEIEATL